MKLRNMREKEQAEIMCNSVERRGWRELWRERSGGSGIKKRQS